MNDFESSHERVSDTLSSQKEWSPILESTLKIDNLALAEIQKRKPDLFLTEEEFNKRYGQVVRAEDTKVSHRGAFKIVWLNQEQGICIKRPKIDARTFAVDNLHREVIALDRLADIELDGKRVLPQLKHVALDQHGWVMAVAMDCIKGRNWEKLNREERTTANPSMEWLLLWIHAKRVALRDIKSTDLFLREDGLPSIIDFGESVIFPPVSKRHFEEVLAFAKQGKDLITALDNLADLRGDPDLGKSLKQWEWEALHYEADRWVFDNEAWKDYQKWWQFWKIFGIGKGKDIERATKAKQEELWKPVATQEIPGIKEKLPRFRKLLAPFLEQEADLNNSLSFLEKEVDSKLFARRWSDFRREVSAIFKKYQADDKGLSEPLQRKFGLLRNTTFSKFEEVIERKKALAKDYRLEEQAASEVNMPLEHALDVVRQTTAIGKPWGIYSYDTFFWTVEGVVRDLEKEIQTRMERLEEEDLGTLTRCLEGRE